MYICVHIFTLYLLLPFYPGMFDKNLSGSIGFEEFSQLWKYVTDWQQCFRSYDKDNSGSIDRSELQNALVNFGKSHSQSFKLYTFNSICITLHVQ